MDSQLIAIVAVVAGFLALGGGFWGLVALLGRRQKLAWQQLLERNPGLRIEKRVINPVMTSLSYDHSAEESAGIYTELRATGTFEGFTVEVGEMAMGASGSNEHHVWVHIQSQATLDFRLGVGVFKGQEPGADRVRIPPHTDSLVVRSTAPAAAAAMLQDGRLLQQFSATAGKSLFSYPASLVWTGSDGIMDFCFGTTVSDVSQIELSLQVAVAFARAVDARAQPGPG